MPIIKTYHIAKRTEGPKIGNGNLNFITDHEKVSETIFNDILDSKIKELLGEKRSDQFSKVKETIIEALEVQKKPVSVLDRTFEIKFKNKKS